jgi:DNA-binding GntR family transcriptional regulator
MRSIGAVIEAALRASFRLSAPTEEREREITIAAHERIVDAIADRNAEAAAAAMTEVISTACAAMVPPVEVKTGDGHD